ncbi:14822_t:CDS:2, partial [Racocetra fulgida]
MKSKPDKTIESYFSALKELCRKVDPNISNSDKDKRRKFIDSLCSEFHISVESAISDDLFEA